MKEMKEQGVEIVDVDKALFEEAVKPVVDKFLSDASVEFQVSPALKTLLKLHGDFLHPMVNALIQLVVCIPFFLCFFFLPAAYQSLYPGCYDFLTLFPRSFLHGHSSFRQHHIEYPGGSPYPHVIKILLQIRQNHLQGAPINTPFSLYLRGLQPKPTT